jgi:hypothetical protein
MDFKPLTPKIRMQCRGLLRRDRTWWDTAASEYGVSSNEIVEALDDFITMSLRLNGSKSKVDFKWVAIGDDAETIQKKFTTYLNTKTADEVWKLERALIEFDAPDDTVTAPEEPSDPEA